MDVTPDAKRFLVGRTEAGSIGETFVVITDWFDDLRQRAPIPK